MNGWSLFLCSIFGLLNFKLQSYQNIWRWEWWWGTSGCLYGRFVQVVPSCSDGSRRTDAQLLLVGPSCQATKATEIWLRPRQAWHCLDYWPVLSCLRLKRPSPRTENWSQAGQRQVCPISLLSGWITIRDGFVSRSASLEPDWLSIFFFYLDKASWWLHNCTIVLSFLSVNGWPDLFFFSSSAVWPH